jgi:hypothetical protein
MSTKIHAGFRIPGANLEDAFWEINAFRTRIAAMKRTEIAAIIARDAVATIDNAAASALFSVKIQPPKNPLLAASMHLMTRAAEIRKTCSRDPLVDFSYEMTLHPTSEGILGISFTERTSWHSAWLDTLGVEDFGYWDNTDPSEDVSCSEWGRREQLWTEVLRSDPLGRPGLCGLSATISDGEIELPTCGDVHAAIPGFADRKAAVAERAVRAIFFRSAAEDDPLDSSSWIRKANEIMRSPEGLESLAGATARAGDLIAPEITEAMLTN